MKFYYNMEDTYDHPRDQYWSEEEIWAVRIYVATPELEKEAMEERSRLWPVHDIVGWSWESVECKDIKEAYNYLGVSLNHSVYEYINDL